MFKKSSETRIPRIDLYLNGSDYGLSSSSRKLQFNKEPIENQYIICDEIGSGQFAVVRLAISKGDSDQKFAAKFIRKRRTQASRRGLEMKDIVREAEILRDIDHSNIVKLYDVYDTQQDIILLLELVPGGELFHYLVNKNKVSETEAVGYLTQILQALRYIHDRDIVHLDLKPENIVLGGPSETNIKLIDFGLSQKIEPGKEHRGLQGTPEFVAPEVINYDPLSTATDMWSVGVITYIMLSGCSPFLGEDKQETLANASAAVYEMDDESFSTTSALAKDFISRLIVKQPDKRMTAEECILHSWISPLDKKQEEYRRRSTINIPGLKSFIARRRWKVSFNAVCLFNHLNKRGRILRSQSAHSQVGSKIQPLKDKDGRSHTPDQGNSRSRTFISKSFCRIEDKRKAEKK